jgi:hypothetical protein
MCSAISIIATLSIVVFLGGAAFGMFLLFIISIHRTSRAPLSDIHGERGGSVSRHVLTGGRVTRKESSE